MPLPLLAAPAVGLILSWLSRLLMLKAGLWIAGAMVSVGIYFGTQTFLVQPLIEQVMLLAQGAFVGEVTQWAAFLNLDKAITMVMSAYTAAAAITAVKTALFKR